MQGTWRVYLISGLVAGLVSAITTVVTVLCLWSLGAVAPQTTVLEGVAEIPWGAELDVYYKAPFAGPPNLSFPEGLDTTCQVVDQKPGSFKLHRNSSAMTGGQFAKVKWRAEGQLAK
jgi:hypothetical protein